MDVTERIRLAVCEPDSGRRKAFEEAAASLMDFSLLGSAGEGEELKKLLEQNRPDAVVTELFTGQTDALCVMERALKGKRRGEGPAFYVLMPEGGLHLIGAVMGAGASYVFSPPHDAQQILWRIAQLFRLQEESLCPKEAGAGLYEGIVPKSSGAAQPAPAYGVKAGAVNERALGDVLMKIGIPVNVRGYQFLREAVRVCIQRSFGDDPCTLYSKDVYPLVARHFGVTPSQVERGIRNAIQQAFLRGSLGNLEEVLGSRLHFRNERPTNGELICVLTDKFVQESKIHSFLQ